MREGRNAVIHLGGKKIEPRAARDALAAAQARGGAAEADILAILWDEGGDPTLLAEDRQGEGNLLGREGLMLGGVLINQGSSQRLCDLLDAAPYMDTEVKELQRNYGTYEEATEMIAELKALSKESMAQAIGGIRAGKSLSWSLGSAHRADSGGTRMTPGAVDLGGQSSTQGNLLGFPSYITARDGTKEELDAFRAQVTAGQLAEASSISKRD